MTADNRAAARGDGGNRMGGRTTRGAGSGRIHAGLGAESDDPDSDSKNGASRDARGRARAARQSLASAFALAKRSRFVAPVFPPICEVVREMRSAVPGWVLNAPPEPERWLCCMRL